MIMKYTLIKLDLYPTIFYWWLQWKMLVKLYKKKKEANGKTFNKEEKTKKFQELVNLIYDEKIKILKEELLKQ